MGSFSSDSNGLMVVKDYGFAVDQTGSAMSAPSELSMDIQKGGSIKGNLTVGLYKSDGTLLKQIKVRPQDLVDFQKLIKLKINVAATTPADVASTDSLINYEMPETVPFRVKLEASGNYQDIMRCDWKYWSTYDAGGAATLNFGSLRFEGQGHADVVADTTFSDQFA